MTTPPIILTAPDVDFARKAADPRAWRAVAISLLCAAEMLWTRLLAAMQELEEKGKGGSLSDEADIGLRLRGPFYLLAGLAIENMLKAVIVKRKIDLGGIVTEGDTLLLDRGKHNLNAIATKGQIELIDGEREFLDRVSTYVLWAGRYPVATNRAVTAQERIAVSDDWSRLSNLVRRLSREVEGKK